MSDNPNDKKNLDDASLLSAALSSSPMIGGVGYGLHQMMKERQFRPPRETPFASAARRIGGYGFSSASKTASLDWLTQNAHRFAGAEAGEIARVAWLDALASVHPSAKVLMGFSQNLNSMPA